MQLTIRSRSTGRRKGRVFGTLFFGLFGLLGLLFTAILIAGVVGELAVLGWDEVPCRIVDSRVVDSGDDESPYRLEVRYLYRVDGVEHSGDRVTRSDAPSSSYDRVRDRALRYAAGSDATCRVRPGRSGDAVLEASFPWFVLAAPLPLVFLAIGVIGVAAVWRRRPERPVAMTASSDRAHRIGVWAPIALGGIFVAAGAAAFVFLGILPVARTLQAAGWTPTACTIVDSRVRSYQSDDGTTYRIDILYEYVAGGRTWRSNRFDFIPGSSSGYDAKREVVDGYPEGAAATCFVDPDDPSRSVLRRGFGARHLLGLVPLAFLIPGAAVLAWGLGRRRRASGGSVAAGVRTGARAPDAAVRSVEQALGQGSTVAAPATGPTVLEPRYSPLHKVLGATVVAVFWNGIVSVFAWQVVESWRRGDPDWFLTLFLTPFVLVGLAMISAIGYFALAAFNPRPVLTVSEGSPRLGGRLEVTWRLRGATGRLRRLRITLEGREEATYRRGTDTHTDRRVFARGRVLDTTHPMQMRQGGASIDLPDDLAPSFEAPSNKIVWALKVDGEIPRWPDVGDEFPIPVRPPRGRSGP